ncbi:MAG: HAMP domain-containing sensor histidine kinase [Ruthenibacterium sp.]
MEQRKGVSLIALLLRYIALCAVACILVLGAAWLAIGLAIQSGAVLPAGAAERAATDAKEKIAQHGVFDASLVPPVCDYFVCNADGAMSATSLTEKKDAKALAAAQKYAATGSNTGGYFHCMAPLGTQRCILQYRFTMQYTNPTVNAYLPDFQVLLVLCVPLVLLAILAGITLYEVHLLKRSLVPLNAAAEQLARGDLERDFTPSGVKEYNAVLSSMQGLKTALQTSLRAQWSMEQSRDAQTAALAHDLKTPLTVIDGNAQLLAESAQNLTAAQQQSVEAILRGAASAQDYVGTLRQLALAKAENQFMRTEIDGAAFLQKIEAGAREICAVHGVLFAMTAQKLPHLTLEIQEIERAAANLVENAAEHTPREKTVQMRCFWQAPTLLIVVEDAGTGFTPQALAHATEFLFTENESRTQNGHTGLGLATAKATAQKYGGSVTVKNNENGHGEAWLTLSF